MIGGFIVNGTEPKMVAIRGVGPSLGSSSLTGVLADPTLELRGSDGALIAQNDNWQDDSKQAAQLSKLGLALQSPQESGIVADLQPGAYTAVLAGKDQTAGIGLVEIYDVDSVAASQLANLSTRGSVQTAEEVMIGGFILGNGVGNTDVVVRGIGPSLSQAGLSGVLADPILELRNGDGGLLLSNDNWQDDSVSAAQLTAHGLAPQNSMESGIFATLSPGAYTAILAGKNGGVGLGLIEIYHLGEAASPTPSPIPVQHPIVTTMSDSGAGSLREAIALVSDGGLIEFDAALNGGSIDLTSSELVIDKNITITGPGFELLTVSRDGNAATSFRIFHIRPNRIVTIQGLTISGGSAMGSDSTGGAIYNEPESSLLLMNCNLVNNHASSEFLFGGGSGGAITNHGILEIRNCNLNGNGASAFHSGSGGAVISDGTLAIVSSTLDANSAGVDGGAISNSGSASITASTISNNTAYGHPLTGGSGGGIVNSGPMTITNSTISGNVVGFGYGSGIVSAVGPLIVSHSTFSGNSFTDPVGSAGGIYLSSGTLEIEDTILNAGAISDNLVSNSGTVISNGYNLSSDDGGALLNGIGDQLNVDPMVGPLQDNGGPTLTHALLPGSPAINAGDPNFTPPPLFDQRGEGYDRNSDGRIDIGSFEVQTVR